MHRTRLASLLFCAVLTAAAGSARADNVVQQAPTQSPPAAQPTTTVVQPAPATVVQPAPAQTAVATPTAAPAAQSAPVVQQTNVSAESESDDDGPSAISHAFKGLLAGALVGSGAGYLVGRREGWQRSDWRSVGLGLGIGSLAGAGLGLSLGIADRADARGSRYIARDMLAGAGFGAVVGTIGGGISAAVKDDPERVLVGLSIGVIAGAGLGLLTGVIEGQLHGRESSRTTTTTTSLRLRPDLTIARSARGNIVAPGLVGTF